MTTDDKLIELAGLTGEHEVKIKELENECFELKQRPCLPGWICRWATHLSIIMFVTVIGGTAVNSYRLGEVEKSSNRVSDRLQSIEIRLASLNTTFQQNKISSLFAVPDATDTTPIVLASYTGKLGQ